MHVVLYAHTHSHTQTVAFAKDPESKNVDLEALKERITSEMARMQAAKTPVAIVFDEEDNRSIQVAGFHTCGCGGTHVKSANMIKTFVVKDLKVKKQILKVKYDTEANLEAFQAAVDESSSSATDEGQQSS
jgi:Ser-tRNA(Ala) deacylase AlaX